MVKIDKMKDPEILKIARTYFFVGLAFLPWLWLINFLYIFPIIRKRPSLDRQIVRYVWMSLAGSIVWLVILLVWITLYLTQRNRYGTIADAIAINIPIGW
ncbi:gamma-secretase aspartyl protease complex, presenilin enhancer-2 subunit [Polychytrium aggregatum]|uniref:gamma-secretase aspartyl protease complex, presenilin enhancer-2 subunit n=1 Tax=Polychytrium aggregatum TaxID=110093 RepID=UPI0022FE5CDF|nr:gamma-secretase aspartyl protease complex, presenilin enhancer-2 subunit [Polychytrium aggregatum]KAI9204014.1 gamma-secretase aspartyl protease complex, presenilin enhancer-2 subunit [Polychytrium aggregatum]